jgi:hypothetical protein
MNGTITTHFNDKETIFSITTQSFSFTAMAYQSAWPVIKTEYLADSSIAAEQLSPGGLTNCINYWLKIVRETYPDKEPS